LWFPVNIFKTDGLTLSLHDPDEMPGDMIGIEAFRESKIHYNVEVSDEIEAKSIVNCRGYDLKSDDYSQRSRYDCMKKCLQEEQDRCTNCTNEYAFKCMFAGRHQWTKDQLPSPRFQLYNLDILNFENVVCNESQFHMDTTCKNKCRPKCIDRHYNYQVTSSAKALVTQVEIDHKQQSDELYKLAMKMSLVDFMSQLGGLFGLWLGLSAYAISDHILTLFKCVSSSISKKFKSPS
jgi:hypothetical protein